MVRQSFDIFNTYGKNAGQFENILFGFVKVLEPYDTKTITTSFNRWMTSQSAMPTPADIAKECAEIETCKPRPKGPELIALPRPTPKAVPWYGKEWKELTESDKANLKAHVSRMEHVKAGNYCHWLISAMNYPTNFMGA